MITNEHIGRHEVRVTLSDSDSKFDKYYMYLLFIEITCENN